MNKRKYQLLNLALTAFISISLISSSLLAQTQKSLPQVDTVNDIQKLDRAEKARKKKLAERKKRNSRLQNSQANAQTTTTKKSLKSSHANNNFTPQKSNRANLRPIYYASNTEALPRQASPSATSQATIAKAAPDAKKSKLNGSVAMTLGRDSNVDIDRTADYTDTFFEVAPSVKFTQPLTNTIDFGTNFSARTKDFTQQETSDIARENEFKLGGQIKMGLVDGLSTTSKVDLVYSDARWPDFIDKTDKGTPIRYFESKFTQSLNWSYNPWTFGVNGSYAYRDFTNTWSDNQNDLVGRLFYDRDFEELKLDSNISLALNDYLTFIAKPMIKNRKYVSEPGRQTSGQRGGAALDANTPRLEIFSTEIGADLKMSFGPVTLTPGYTFAQDEDRSRGALDASKNTYSGVLEVMVAKELGLKLGANTSYTSTDFKNWTFLVNPNGELRQVKSRSSGLSAGINVTKSSALSLNYTREESSSNLPAFTDENFKRSVIGSTFTFNF